MNIQSHIARVRKKEVHKSWDKPRRGLAVIIMDNPVRLEN